MPTARRGNPLALVTKPLQACVPLSNVSMNSPRFPLACVLASLFALSPFFTLWSSRFVTSHQIMWMFKSYWLRYKYAWNPSAPGKSRQAWWPSRAEREIQLCLYLRYAYPCKGALQPMRVGILWNASELLKSPRKNEKISRTEYYNLFFFNFFSSFFFRSLSHATSGIVKFNRAI